MNRPHQERLLLHQHWLQEAATVEPTTLRTPTAPPALATGGRNCSIDHTKEACCSTSTGYRRPQLLNRPHQERLLLHQHWLHEMMTVLQSMLSMERGMNVFGICSLHTYILHALHGNIFFLGYILSMLYFCYISLSLCLLFLSVSNDTI